MPKFDYGFGTHVGANAESRAYALGARAKKVRRIMTPVEDRFPSQSCDLEIEEFFNYRMPRKTKDFESS